MRYRIFPAEKDNEIDTARLVQNARLYFGSRVEILEYEPRRRLQAKITGPSDGAPVEVDLVVRKISRKDREDIRDAEHRGGAAGMGGLTARSPVLWELTTPDDAEEANILAFVAALASIALGPVLPPDNETLYAIQGAMERAARCARR